MRYRTEHRERFSSDGRKSTFRKIPTIPMTRHYLFIAFYIIYGRLRCAKRAGTRRKPTPWRSRHFIIVSRRSYIDPGRASFTILDTVTLYKPSPAALLFPIRVRRRVASTRRLSLRRIPFRSFGMTLYRTRKREEHCDPCFSRCRFCIFIRTDER